MDKLEPSIAHQIAQAAIAFQRRRAGTAPKSVAVVHSEGTLVITVHGALSPAEMSMARTAEGAEQVQEFHRQLFQDSVEEMRQAIAAITGVAVREAAAEVDATTGNVVQVFSSGSMVQVFLLAGNVPEGSWSGSAAAAAACPGKESGDAS